ncbi:MAG: hypothetical protein ACI9W2_002658 [Gammaproteobacteria bacterium]
MVGLYVETLLFVLMAVAGHLLWRGRDNIVASLVTQLTAGSAAESLRRKDVVIGLFGLVLLIASALLAYYAGRNGLLFLVGLAGSICAYVLSSKSVKHLAKGLSKRTAA